MSDKQQHTPHPLVVQPTLWVVDVPLHVRWSHLAQVLKPCGEVRSGGRSTTQEGRQRWEITFCDAYYAEMALATLNGLVIPNISPSWTLTLSHTSSLDSALPKEPLCAQFVKAPMSTHILLHASAQQVFRWFRPAGPLATVQVKVDVGQPNGHHTCIIQYWHEEDALQALRKGRLIHSALKNYPEFTLRTFSQWTVRGLNMGIDFHPQDINRVFGRFGTIIHYNVKQSGSLNCHCHVSFGRPEEATAAIMALNNQKLNGRKIHIRNFELGSQFDFHLRQTGGNALAPHQLKCETSPEPQKPPEPSAENQEYTQPEAQYAPRKDEPRSPENTSTAHADKQRKKVEAEYNEKLAQATRKREAAAEAANVARLARIDAETIERAAQTSLAEALTNRDDTSLLLTEASAAVIAAEAALEKARARQAEIVQQFTAVAASATEADQYQRTATWRRIGAEQHEATLVKEQQRAEQDEQELRDAVPPEVAEARRQEELKESIRKMRELREIEEADRREQARREQQERDEKVNREREEREEAERLKKEAERLAREGRERLAREEVERKAREEREKREAETRRLNAYKIAAAKEVERCRKRDVTGKIFGSQWTGARSVQRFKEVSIEFEGIKFCDSQPLTFESVPWPLLSPPHKATIDDIDWGAVEAFFAAAKLMVPPGEYKAFVEKSHRRFHPDKWRARGLLNTILDEDLRQQLENAGNVVAQAITPIWLQTKSK